MAGTYSEKGYKWVGYFTIIVTNKAADLRGVRSRGREIRAGQTHAMQFVIVMMIIICEETHVRL